MAVVPRESAGGTFLLAVLLQSTNSLARSRKFHTELRARGFGQFHFYTLNRSDATRVIFDNLVLPRHRNAQASSA